MEELKKSRTKNKALKEQLTKVEEQTKDIKAIQEALERKMNDKETYFDSTSGPRTNQDQKT